MSNLNPKQFQQAKVTRILKAAGEERRRRGTTRKRTSYPVWHAGFDYTPVDANTTALEWHGNGNGRVNEEARDQHHARILEALTAAGMSAKMHEGKIHLKH